MKVLVPVVDNESAKNDIVQEFYEAKYFCIHDSLNNTCEWLPLSSITNKMGNLSFALKRKGILSVITKEIPEIAIQLFIEMGITIYVAQGNNLHANLKLFGEKQLGTFVVSNHDHLHIASSCNGSCNSGSCSC